MAHDDQARPVLFGGAHQFLNRVPGPCLALVGYGGCWCHCGRKCLIPRRTSGR